MGEELVSKNFIEQEIDKDLAEGVYTEVCTRFPPEPNGYLHIGHAKSILLNYGLAEKYNGTFHLRFDDTNPTKEDLEFVESIKEDVKWLGADWKEHLYFASDYFEVMYECAVKLIKKGKAFVCDLTAEEMREYRGTLTEPGKNSPYRDRSVEENLRLFEEMRDGKYQDGEKVLRAKIDMASPNINMRDPVDVPDPDPSAESADFLFLRSVPALLLLYSSAEPLSELRCRHQSSNFLRW